MTDTHISFVKQKFFSKKPSWPEHRFPVLFFTFEDSHSSNDQYYERSQHSLDMLNKYWFS